VAESNTHGQRAASMDSAWRGCRTLCLGPFRRDNGRTKERKLDFVKGGNEHCRARRLKALRSRTSPCGGLRVCIAATYSTGWARLSSCSACWPPTRDPARHPWMSTRTLAGISVACWPSSASAARAAHLLHATGALVLSLVLLTVHIETAAPPRNHIGSEVFTCPVGAMGPFGRVVLYRRALLFRET
jgi:hypothetical protein